MSRRSCLYLLAFFLLPLTGAAVAQGHSQEHGHGRGHGKPDKYAYTDHDRDEARGWYREHEQSLPPGLAKRDRLPPGLEKQLAVRGTLPPGLQKRMRPCPIELERRLPPPPLGYAHMVIGGHLVLINRNTHLVLDIIHLE